MSFRATSYTDGKKQHQCLGVFQSTDRFQLPSTSSTRVCLFAGSIRSDLSGDSVPNLFQRTAGSAVLAPSSADAKGREFDLSSRGNGKGGSALYVHAKWV